METHGSLTRREFLHAAAVGIAATAILPRALSLAGQTAPPRRPNILMIISDEHNAGVLGGGGNSLVRTPNLDGLVAQGVLFENCYCNSPLCVPSRLSFLSGKYASRVGAWNNSCRLPSAEYPSVPAILNRAGYQAYLCGKMHLDAACRYGFQEIGKSPTNAHHMGGRGKRRQADDLKASPGYSIRFKDSRPGASSFPMDHDRRVTGDVTQFLSGRKAGDEPFFLVAGYIAPHFPLTAPEALWRHYEGKVPMPQIPEGHLKSQPLNYQHLRVGFHVEDVPEEVIRRSREFYYALTEWMDGQVGRVLAALARSGLADNTVIIYSADHGENMGEHGLWWKNCMYEHAAHVPLIVSSPARWKGGQRRRGACSLLDVARTITSLGGAESPADWNGDSLVPWLDDPATKWKDRAVSEYYAHNIASGYAMIRIGMHKYVYHTPADDKHPAQREIYDLQADPGELDNLAGKAEQRQRLEEMHRALVREIGEEPDRTEQRCRTDIARGYGPRGAGSEPNPGAASLREPGLGAPWTPALKGMSHDLRSVSA